MTMRLSEGCGTWYPENTTSGSRCSCLGGRARERGGRRVSDGVPSIARSLARSSSDRSSDPRTLDRASVRPRGRSAARGGGVRDPRSRSRSRTTDGDETSEATTTRREGRSIDLRTFGQRCRGCGPPSARRTSPRSPPSCRA
eukprot:30308-Pelagococcus_subviridis.AAC.12